MPDAAGSPSTADVPPVWLSPTEGLLQASATGFGVVLMVGHTGLTELPADAVRLVPAGGSAPAEAAVRRVVETIDFADSSYDYVCADVDTDVIRLALLNRKDIDVTTAVLRDEIRAFVASLAGGSAPHQGATTDVTALLARLAKVERVALSAAAIGLTDGEALITTAEVRALLGAGGTPDETGHHAEATHG